MHRFFLRAGTGVKGSVTRGGTIGSSVFQNVRNSMVRPRKAVGASTSKSDEPAAAAAGSKNSLCSTMAAATKFAANLLWRPSFSSRSSNILKKDHVGKTTDSMTTSTAVGALPHNNRAALFSTAVVDDEEKAKAPTEKFRKDYKPPPYWIKNVELDIRVYDGRTAVISKLSVERDANTAPGTPMVLDGEDLSLKKITIDGKETKDYSTDKLSLTIGGGGKDNNPLPESFILETEVEIIPEENTQLSGLYKSGSMYCTQCEAEGFRRITYHLDRPDVMAKYLVRVEADKSWPVLLSNGNLIDSGDVVSNDESSSSSPSSSSSRHFAIFEDPYPKPSYLFAVVVGDLGKITDKFITMSGREVELNVFSEAENVDALDHAMLSLKKSMKWDEERWGREYDLDVYHIVAVNDFNMGAMENKGLNVFNTALTLAKPETATDMDYMRIEGVIGHEYFHNWSGNRVTCRDWFQLTLKEGLTVRATIFKADFFLFQLVY